MASDISVDDIVIRPASHDDYEAVMNIRGDVQGRSDYLPKTYHQFLQDPKIYPYVAEHGGKIISYQAGDFGTDGKVQYWLGGRTSPEYEDKGVAKALGTEIFINMSLRNPEPVARLWIGLGSEKQDRYLEANSYAQVVHRWSQHLFEVQPIKLQNCLVELQKSASSVTAEALSYQNAVRVIPQMMSFYKKQKLEFIYELPLPYRPREISPNSLRRILMKSSCISSTDLRGNEILALSTFSCLANETNDGLMSCFDFHGDTMELWLSHWKVYVKCLLELCPENAKSVSVYVSYPETLGDSVYSYLSTQLGDSVALNKGRTDVFLIRMKYTENV